jgi:hypothetical protein
MVHRTKARDKSAATWRDVFAHVGEHWERDRRDRLEKRLKALLA